MTRRQAARQDPPLDPQASELSSDAAGSNGRANHYSYAVYADPQTADTFEADRFGGPIGTLLAESQERVLLEFLGTIAGRTVLDVGTGAGRAALALARRGARVTAIDAAWPMLEVARRRAEADGLSVRFMTGDAHRLTFPDRSFDVAISLRVLMHTPEWRQCVGELCRVAHSRVVFDYPALCSAAALQAAARRVADGLGRPVQAYRVLSDRVVARVLASHDFQVVAIHRQFVLPIALHRRIRSRRFTEGVERLLAQAGLLSMFGSPVTIAAERCGS